MMVKRWGLRTLRATMVLSLAIAGPVGGAVPATAHSNSCSTGNANQVVIVFQNANQDGSDDDLCWKDTYSEDNEFSVNESNVDDVGENANFHDIVSSLSIKNTSATNDLCIWLYTNANQGGTRKEYWVGNGVGDIHVNQVTHNDAYDSLDLKRLSQGSCLP